MKKIIAAVMALMLILESAAVLAEDLTEYSDDHFAFRYPADWTCDGGKDGTVILRSPDGASYVRADVLLMDLITLTGDAETDARFVEVLMKSLSESATDGNGNGLVLDGTWEPAAAGELHGFRAPGTWQTSGIPAGIAVFTGGGCMVSFILIGEQAVALTDTLISSLRVTDRTAESVNGMKKWESERISLLYPENFKMMSMSGNDSVVFTEIAEQPSMINVMSSELADREYDTEYGLATMNEALKQSGEGMAESAEIRQIGGRDVITAEGLIDGTPGAVYAFGQGKTVVVINFIGAGAVSAAEVVTASVEFK